MTLFVLVVFCHNHLWLIYLNPTAHHLGTTDVQRMIRSPVRLRNWKLCSKNDQKKSKLSWLPVAICKDCSCVFSSTRSVVRLAASLLTKLVDSLAPSITSVLVHGKQVSEHTVSRA